MTARDVAQQFGTLIVQHNYASAAKLLTEDAQTVNTPEFIEAAVASMTSGATGSILIAQVVEDGIVEEWPEKQPGDVAIVYVALNGECFAEAVMVTVVNYKGNHLIRHLEWGRP
jgi:hypothetical protein